MEHDVLLQMTDICKEFPGVKALDHVSLTVKRGTVHALMGENGEMCIRDRYEGSQQGNFEADVSGFSEKFCCCSL